MSATVGQQLDVGPMHEYGLPDLSLHLHEKLVDFDQLLPHHDEKLANRLDAQYLKEEWEFSREKMGNKSKFRDSTVICGDSRVQMARNQKKKYRSLKSAVGDSEKMLYCCKYGFVRERPKTAPEFTTKASEERQSRKISSAAHNAILQKMQRVLNYSECKRPKEKSFHVDLSDRPVLKQHKRSETPKVVSKQEIVNTAEKWERLMFDIETEGSRHEIHKLDEMDHYIPGYYERKEEEEIHKLTAKKTPASDTMAARAPSTRSTSAKRRVHQEDKTNALAYPVARIPPAHGKRCDARFRGWYNIRSKRGQHYVLVTPYFKDSQKGHLFRKLAKDSSAEVRKIHGDFVHRYTASSQVCQRPVTAPAVMTMSENQAILKRNSSRYRAESSGYASMEENEDGDDDDDNYDDDTHQDDTEEINEHTEKEAETVKENQEECHIDKDIGEDASKESPGDTDQISQSLESVETSLSDKIKLLASFQEPYDINDGRPRAKSALTPKNKGLENDPSNLKDDQEVIWRSRSATGNYQRKASFDETLPVPYMDHSKPRIVSVGSMGKIALLENISEARFWEESIKEEDKLEKHEEVPAKNEESPKKEEHNKGELSEDEKQEEPVKKDVSDDVVDIAELIRKEDRRRRQKIAMRNYSYMSTAIKQLQKQRPVDTSPKSSTRSSCSNELEKHKLNNTKKNTGINCGERKDKNNASSRYEHRKSGKQLNSYIRNSNQHGQVTVSLSNRSNRNDSPQKSVTIDERLGNNQSVEEKLQKNKYERLLKRMGEDMPLEMKRRMLGYDANSEINNEEEDENL